MTTTRIPPVSNSAGKIFSPAARFCWCPRVTGQGRLRAEDLGVPFMVSEFGGIGWSTEGGWGYGAGPKDLEEFYARYAGLVDALLDNPNLFGFCYTQLTDVEQEHNGLYYYDRRPKFDLKRLHAITARPAAYEKTGPTAAEPGGRRRNIPGKFSSARRRTATWPNLIISPRMRRPPIGLGIGFDDSSWPTGLAPFRTCAAGHRALPGTRATSGCARILISR